ncbi:MAG: hypothetical protein AAGG38_10940 [Planctomycetota bacterium]
MTRLKTLLAAASLGLPLLAVGCDDQAARIAQSRANLAEAIELIEQAEQGYASADAGVPYPEYRLQTLAAAADRLQALATAGDPVAQAGASRLLAGIRTSQARSATQDAVAAFARVTSQATGLSNYASAVERINALITARGGNRGGVLAALDDGDQLITAGKTQATRDIARLSAQREAVILKANQFNAELADQLARAQQLEQAAFVAENRDAKRDAYTRAYTVQIEAQANQRRAQEAQIEADRLAEELAARQAELREWNAIAGQVAQLREEVRTDDADAARDVSTAGSTKTVQLARVQEQLAALSTLFDQEVAAPLTAAADHAAAAIEQAGRAASLAAPADRSVLALEHLAVQAELAHVLSRHAAYGRDFAQTLASLAQRPAVRGTPAVNELGSLRSRIDQQAAALTTRAGEVINQALTTARSQQGDGPEGQAYASLSQTLQAYQSRLN